MDSEVEFVVKLRDAALTVVEAAEAYLEKLAPPQVKANGDWNPDKIGWISAQGPKGSYERSEDVDNPDFQALLQNLEEHNGKLSRDGFFYWKFREAQIVGRKEQRGKR